MKVWPLSLHPALLERAGLNVQEPWSSVGNAALLDESLLGLVSSRECPGSVLLETLDRVREWVKAGRVILSGFHAPLEQQVLRSVLRRKGRVVKLLARGITNYRVPADDRASLDEGRILVLTPFPPELRRTTRTTALERNRLVLALSTETVIPYVAEGSPLAALVAERDIKNKERGGMTHER